MSNFCGRRKGKVAIAIGPPSFAFLAGTTFGIGRGSLTLNGEGCDGEMSPLVDQSGNRGELNGMA